MKRTAGADVPAVRFLRETLKMGRGLFDAYGYLTLTVDLGSFFCPLDWLALTSNVNRVIG